MLCLSTSWSGSIRSCCSCSCFSSPSVDVACELVSKSVARVINALGSRPITMSGEKRGDIVIRPIASYQRFRVGLPWILRGYLAFAPSALDDAFPFPAPICTTPESFNDLGFKPSAMGLASHFTPIRQAFANACNLSPCHRCEWLHTGQVRALHYRDTEDHGNSIQHLQGHG